MSIILETETIDEEINNVVLKNLEQKIGIAHQ